MDVASALADLTEISSQIEAAVVLDAKGAVLASTLAEPETDRLARAAVGLYEAATARFRSTGRSVTQLEAALRGGSVFVVREGDVRIAARTSVGPSSGLVFYDLRTCLRAVAEAEQRKPKPRRRAAKKKAETADA